MKAEDAAVFDDVVVLLGKHRHRHHIANSCKGKCTAEVPMLRFLTSFI